MISLNSPCSLFIDKLNEPENKAVALQIFIIVLLETFVKIIEDYRTERFQGKDVKLSGR